MYSTKEEASSYVTIMQEQQNSVKQLVMHIILPPTMKMDTASEDHTLFLSDCHTAE